MPVICDLVYSAVLILLAPWLAWRSFRTGRYRQSVRAKLFGPSSIPNPHSQPVAWFHGVSVGEIHLLVTVVAAFRKRHTDWLCVISSTTDTGIAEARLRFPDCSIIAWPFDFSWAVDTALNTVKPQLVVLAEAELWPNFMRLAKKGNVPVAVINARLSPRSFKRLKLVAPLARWLLYNRTAIIAVQSADYLERLQALGVPTAKHRLTGSIKYDGAIGDRDTHKARELRRLFPSTLTLVAGSTHAPEERIVLDAYRQLQLKFPTLRLILVPRHPDRFDEVAGLIETMGLTFSRRSRLTEPVSTPILLLDSVGELAAAWSLADVGYVGGTLDGKRGGQSMIEPAGFGVPTIFGPHVWNFRDAVRRLIEVKGAFMVHDAPQLERALARLITDTELRTTMGTAARELVREQQGATARTLDALDELIETLPTAKAA